MRGCKRCKPQTITVPAEEFVRVWQTSTSVAEVAAKVRSKKNAVRVRAHRYRRRGVPLKEFEPVEIVLPDWSELAEYAASLVAEQRETDNGGEE